MIDAVVVGVTFAVALPVLVASGRAFACNVRSYQEARAASPIDGIDLTGMAVVPVRPPRGWPAVEDITDPHVAAAYAELSGDRALVAAVVGEMLVLVGGAGAGAAIPLFVRGGWWQSWIVLVPLAIGGYGVLLRLLGVRRWDPVGARYRERYTALSAMPAPEPRRGGLTRFWRR